MERVDLCQRPFEADALLSIDPGYPCPMPTSRLDAFFVSEQELKFTEYNAECPAGAAYCDGLADVFYALPIMREFMKRYRVVPLPPWRLSGPTEATPSF